MFRGSYCVIFFFFSSRRRHTRFKCDWSSDVCSSDKVSGRTITAGYKGSLWIDTETKQVLRVEASDVEIPPDFPINMAEDSVEYDWVTIAGERNLLPTEAQVLLGRDRDRYYNKYVIE